jgi:hypothetical protein
LQELSPEGRMARARDRTASVSGEKKLMKNRLLEHDPNKSLPRIRCGVEAVFLNRSRSNKTLEPLQWLTSPAPIDTSQHRLSFSYWAFLP